MNDKNVTIKDCLNLPNMKLVDINHGKIVNEKLTDEFADKVQFALSFAWTIIATDPEFVKIGLYK